MDRDQIAGLAHDIAFALYRVASQVEFSYLRKELEAVAVEIVSFLDQAAIDRARRLIKLGKAIEEISGVNSEVLIRELRNLAGMMELMEFPEKKVEINLEKLFNRQKNTLPFKRQEEKEVSKRQFSVKPDKRQTEILEFIRQFPNGCRPADISRNFPEVSKRTLRNDISALVDRGSAERIGERGPYSYVRALKGGVERAEGDINEVLFLAQAKEGGKDAFDEY
ncbi:MAG: hypothetical protein UX31_C0004G0012 [Candidatus Nomurabacteria bacterium GW2011_GWA1_46_11]|uniref:HTH deoR-type domain-containing protein n=2 Tax=Parcubacteria group TaxID=1794811 RepID=A0A1G1YVL4_9BACT|nr:MAG: hypothetical protein UX29_C0003G0025 [Parcubacteria group bacterium GW2011_GWA2_46_10]KKU22283.1 MAG: hypothetical protein UX31_C0004G0012 [Candidatus Nomurabacteria bacterium GW2011_GWA1_46_11]OGY56431.1 MAG: hypothetical protein A2119_02215 [Candidatus Colwellbacteria bacterium GWA2_46_10]